MARDARNRHASYATEEDAGPETAASDNRGNRSRPGDEIHVMFVVLSLGAGGSERVITTIANYWAQRGRTVSITSFDPPDMEPFYPLDERVRLVRLGLAPVTRPLLRAVARTAERIGALRRAFREARPDVVISFLTKANIMALQAARGLETPVIISERNNPYLQKFNALWRIARARTYRRAYAFVTMTEGAADFYPEAQRPRTRIIPNPINLPEGWRNRRGGSCVTAVGRLTGQKRFDLLIDAFADVAGDFPEWSLTIWGEGEARADLEGQCERLGLGDRIRLPGLTPEPGSWIETADLFALSSDYEGWPNVVLEAMAAGLPIVATDCPFGAREMLDGGACGLLVPTGSVEALADGLRRLMADRALRDKLGENAKSRAAAVYSTERIIAQWDVIAGEAAASRQ